MWRLVAFVAIVFSAALFDLYLDDCLVSNQVETSTTEEKTQESGHLLIVAQSNIFGSKISTQKSLVRKHFMSTQDKFVQKYHQHRNYQVLKAEVQTQTAPMILSYHYLAFRKTFFSMPDDDVYLA